MTKARKITKAEVFSTGRFAWYWRVTWAKDDPSDIASQSCGSTFTKRGATRKVKRLHKEQETVDKTYHVLT